MVGLIENSVIYDPCIVILLTVAYKNDQIFKKSGATDLINNISRIELKIYVIIKKILAKKVPK